MTSGRGEQNREGDLPLSGDDEPWTPRRIAAASAAWVWLPAGIRELRSADYHLIDYPQHFAVGTQVAWCRSERPAATIVDEVAVQAREWGSSKVGFWITDITSPSDLLAEVRRRRGEFDEAVRVFASDLREHRLDVGPTPGVTTVVVEDEASLRAALAVSIEVWGGTDLPPKEFAKRLQDYSRPLAEREQFQVLALVNGEPAAVAGCSVVDGVAQLWGAATVERLRGRGAYRAVLRDRVELARSIGATLALVKGRVTTSAPILLRAGFAAYGEEELWQLPLG